MSTKSLLSHNTTFYNIPSNVEAIPAIAELQQYNQWIGWRSCPVAGKDKPTKKPYNPHTGVQDGSNTNKANWASYKEAERAMILFEFDGLGFASSEDDPFTFVDLDDSILPDNTLTPYAAYVVNLVDSYFEISPSGTGLRGIVRGKRGSNLPDSAKDGDCKLLLKESGGYSTITGNHWPGSRTTIEERDTELEIIATEARARRQAAKVQQKTDSISARQHTPRVATGNTPYGLTALHAECQELASTPEGGRNTQLNLAAFRLGQLVAGGELLQYRVESDLLAAAENCGLDTDEAEATFKSGFNAGCLHPRSAPQLQPATEDFEDTNNSEEDDLEDITLDQAKVMIRSLRKEVNWWNGIMGNPNVKTVQRLMIKQFMTIEKTARPQVIDGEKWYRIDTEEVGKAIGADKGTVSRNIPMLKAGGVIELKEVPWVAQNGYKNHLLMYRLTGAEQTPAAIELPNKGRNKHQCVECGNEMEVKHRWTARQEIAFCKHCQKKHVYPVEERFALPVGTVSYNPQLQPATEDFDEDEDTQDATEETQLQPATEETTATTQPMDSNVASLSLYEHTQLDNNNIPSCSLCDAPYSGYLAGMWLCSTHYADVERQQKIQRMVAPHLLINPGRSAYDTQ